MALQKFVELPLLTAVVQHPDRSLWFTSQTGEVWKMVEGGQPEMVLDLRGEVAPWAEGSERGMLGIGFNPVDGRLFLYFNDAASDSHVVSYALDANGRPDPASRWDVLFVDQPGVGHKGGGIVFDENGVMMLALGDGGGSRGRDAQDYSKLLGGIIRIIPRTNGPGYDIPGDNPFIGQEGIAPELFAKGLRNPWGFCRDAPTGDMWITDVGEDTVEEVNHIPVGTSGMNFGWYFLEGTQVRYDGAPAAQPATGVGVSAQPVRPGVDRRLRVPRRRHPGPAGRLRVLRHVGTDVRHRRGLRAGAAPFAGAGPHRHGRQDGRRR